MRLDLILIPIISCLIGWFTNWVAVKMLFHPRNPFFIFGYNVQGVFPKRQKALSEKLGEIVSRELITPKDLLSSLSAGLEGNKSLVSSAVSTFLTKSLPEKLPFLSMILTPDMSDKISRLFADNFSVSFQEIVEKKDLKLFDENQIKEIVEQKVASFSTDKLEALLISIMKKEFIFIEILGGVLGFLIGLIQVLILTMPQLRLF